jgi:hypothetical protein
MRIPLVQHCDRNTREPNEVIAFLRKCRSLIDRLQIWTSRCEVHAAKGFAETAVLSCFHPDGRMMTPGEVSSGCLLSLR